MEFPEFVETVEWYALPLRERIRRALHEELLLPFFYERLIQQARKRGPRSKKASKDLRDALREKLESARAHDH